MQATTWNKYIAATAPYAFFQSWEWGEVEKKLGKKVWRLQWPKGIAQVVKIPARRGTFLHIRHGPIGTVDFTDIIALARQEKAWFIRISPQQNVDIPGLVPAPIHAMDGELCWILDLDKSETELLGNMRKTTRYEIKHAEGVTIEKTRELERFFHLYDATSVRKGFIQHTGIREEFETFGAELFVASHQGIDLAAAIIVFFGDEAIYRHGASVPSKIPASYIIQWEAIREAKKRGKKVYNFWGIAPENKPNHPWRGITLFKKGFGGREVSFLHAQDLSISPFYLMPRTIETVRRVLKGY